MIHNKRVALYVRVSTDSRARWSRLYSGDSARRSDRFCRRDRRDSSRLDRCRRAPVRSCRRPRFRIASSYLTGPPRDRRPPRRTDPPTGHRPGPGPAALARARDRTGRLRLPGPARTGVRIRSTDRLVREALQPECALRGGSRLGVQARHAGPAVPSLSVHDHDRRLAQPPRHTIRRDPQASWPGNTLRAGVEFPIREQTPSGVRSNF